jgi:hypothetical protein
MKVWVYHNYGSLRFENEESELIIDRDNKRWEKLGTLDLPIVQEKKEVVKRVDPIKAHYHDNFTKGEVFISKTLPFDAYDIVVEYKIKE